MYLMARPPYVRWTAAAALVGVGLLVECSGPATTPHPYAQIRIARGEAITSEAIEWRDIPSGLLTAPASVGSVATIDIPAGTPLVGALTTNGAVAPDGWWAVTLDLPGAAQPGSDVLVFLTASGLEVPGIVVESASAGGFGIEEPGVVAVPPESAAAVATAAALGDVVVATRP